MEWKEWIGKIVFIKLRDGDVFSYSKVLSYEEPFMALTDKFNLPVVVNVSEIIKIKEEHNDGR